MARIDDLRIDDAAAAPAPRRWWRRERWPVAIGVVVIALALVLALAGLFSGRGGGDATAVAGRSMTAGTPADPAPARSVVGSLTAGGYVEIIPPGPTVVTARVAGWVERVAVVEGATVAAGEVLVTLDETVPRQRLAEAEAAADLARAHLTRLQAGFRPEEVADAAARREQATARADFARAEVVRLEKLAAIGAVAERELLAARAELAAREGDLAAAVARHELHVAGSRPEDLAVAEAELARTEATAARLRWQVEQCVVRAPRDGVVLERFVRVGDWTAAAEDADGRGALLTLFDPRRLQVWVDVNQRDAGTVAAGQPVELRADAWRDRIVPGRVAAIMPRANLQRNTVEVKIEILADETAVGAWLRPEMSVQVTFLPQDATPADHSTEGTRP